MTPNPPLTPRVSSSEAPRLLVTDHATALEEKEPNMSHRTTGPLAGVILALGCMALLAPVLAPAGADDESPASPLDRIPEADRKPIEGVVEQLFTTLEKGGAGPAFKTVAVALAHDAPAEQATVDAFIDGPAGGAEQHEVIDVTPIGRLGAAYDVRVISYHRQGLAAWRLRFYLRTADRRWSVTDIEVETRFPAELLTRSPLELAALRAQAQAAARRGR